MGVRVHPHVHTCVHKDTGGLHLLGKGLLLQIEGFPSAGLHVSSQTASSLGWYVWHHSAPT